jgi:YHS domain-containing protein
LSAAGVSFERESDLETANQFLPDRLSTGHAQEMQKAGGWRRVVLRLTNWEAHEVTQSAAQIKIRFSRILSGIRMARGSGAAWLTRQAGRKGDPFGKLRAGSSLRLKDGCAQDDQDNDKNAPAQSERAGKTFSFCSEECRKRFEQSPEQYAERVA